MFKHAILTNELFFFLLAGALITQTNGIARESAAKTDAADQQKRLIYELNFSDIFQIMSEDDLFNKNIRFRLPAHVDWIQEGEGRVWTENSALCFNALTVAAPELPTLFLWNARRFPKDFLLELQLAHPQKRELDFWLFFAATGDDNGSIFDVNQPRRSGAPDKYYFGSLNSYAISVKIEAVNSDQIDLTLILWQNYGRQLLAQSHITKRNNRADISLQIQKCASSIKMEIDECAVLTWENQTGIMLADGYIGFGFSHQSEAVQLSQLHIWKLL